MLHQLLQRRVRILNHAAGRIHHLPKVVGRDVGRHTHRDTGGAVDQKVGEAGGQHHRFLKMIVIVGHKVHRILVDIGEHSHGDFAHSRFGIPIGRCRVPVHRAKVAVSVHQGIAHGKILRQANHRVVNRGVAMGMVPAQHRTDGIRRFSVGFIRGKAVFIHRIQNPAVHRL